jgi:hypothetical protein
VFANYGASPSDEIKNIPSLLNPVRIRSRTDGIPLSVLRTQSPDEQAHHVLYVLDVTVKTEEGSSRTKATDAAN